MDDKVRSFYKKYVASKADSWIWEGFEVAIKKYLSIFFGAFITVLVALFFNGQGAYIDIFFYFGGILLIAIIAFLDFALKPSATDTWDDVVAAFLGAGLSAQLLMTCSTYLLLHGYQYTHTWIPSDTRCMLDNLQIAPMGTQIGLICSYGALLVVHEWRKRYLNRNRARP